jgi:rod shape determining protein RodA
MSGLGGVFGRSAPRLGGGRVRRFAARVDWPLIGGIAVLCAVALLNLYSSTYNSAHGAKFTNQCMWIAIGATVLLVLTVADYQALSRFTWVGLGGVTLLILYVRLFTDPIKGSQRWLDLGFARLQPSELAKIAIIVALARLVHDHASGELGRRRLLAALTGMVVCVGLVAFQPDLGTAILLVMIIMSVGVLMVRGAPTFVGLALTGAGLTLLVWNLVGPWLEGQSSYGLTALRAVLLVIAGGLLFSRRLWPVAAGVVAGVAAPLFWASMEGYQQNRIRCFLDSSFDPKKLCWHINQSIVSIGSGRLTGKGYHNATQNQFNFLPEHWTDFPFSIWAEEWGFVGSVALLALYGYLILWILGVALRAKDQFGTAICVGVASMLFWHVVVNIGMVMRMLPVVGVTLPLVSYGGSSVLTVFIGLGLVSSVSARSRS